MATGRKEWLAAAEEIRAAGVSLTTVGIGGMWAEAAPLEQELAGLGGVHLAARDGQEASVLLRGALWPQDSRRAQRPAVRLVLDPDQVAYAELVGWDDSRPTTPTPSSNPSSRPTATAGSTTPVWLTCTADNHQQATSAAFSSIPPRASTHEHPHRIPAAGILHRPTCPTSQWRSWPLGRRLAPTRFNLVDGGKWMSRAQRPNHPEGQSCSRWFGARHSSRDWHSMVPMTRPSNHRSTSCSSGDGLLSDLTYGVVRYGR